MSLNELATIEVNPTEAEHRVELRTELAALRRQNLGVEWYLPGVRRAFASTTRATSDLISLLGEDGCTFAQARDEINFDSEGALVLEWFCLNGYGDAAVADYVR